MNSLFFALFIQLGAKQIFSNVMEVGAGQPRAGARMTSAGGEACHRVPHEAQGGGSPPTGPLVLTIAQERKQIRFTWADILAKNDPYDTFEDFKEIVIQFGYVMFFASAFPAASSLALLNNVFEIRWTLSCLSLAYAPGWMRTTSSTTNLGRPRCDPTASGCGCRSSKSCPSLPSSPTHSSPQ